MTQAALISKFFAIGTSGPTVDGREIDPADIDAMAASYDPAEYTALINMEHFRFKFPGMSLGKVVSLKSEADGKGRRKLFAQIEPTPWLLDLNGQKQKLFTSMEIKPNFASSGKPYLIGLAVTDSPASLGIEALCFSAKNDGPTDDRFKNNLFTSNFETENFAMADDKDKPSDTKPAPKPEGDDTPKQTFAQKFAEKFKPAQKKNEDQFSDLQDASLELADKFTELEDKFSKLEESNAALVKTNEAQQAEITKLTSALENTPEGDESRPPATGENENQTDC